MGYRTRIYADFINNVYEIDGVAKVLSDILIPHPDDAGGSYILTQNASGILTSDQGVTPGYPSPSRFTGTAAFVALMDSLFKGNGFTIVFGYQLASVSGFPFTVMQLISDGAAYLQLIQGDGTIAQSRFFGSTGAFSIVNTTSAFADPHKAAWQWRKPTDTTAFSFDGADPVTDSGGGVTWTDTLAEIIPWTGTTQSANQLFWFAVYDTDDGNNTIPVGILGTLTTDPSTPPPLTIPGSPPGSDALPPYGGPPVAGEDEVTGFEAKTAPQSPRQLRLFEQRPFAEFQVRDTAVSAFPIRFKVLAQTDLRVTIDGVELGQDAFTFTGQLVRFPGYDDADAISDDPDFIAKNAPVPTYRGGVVMLDTAVSDCIVRIWSDPAPARTTDLTAGEMKMAQANRAFEILWLTDRAQHQNAQRAPVITPDGAHQLSEGESGTLFRA